MIIKLMYLSPILPARQQKSRKGVCDDQSILHYALTWKALKELEWTDDQINNRLGVVVNAQEGYVMYIIGGRHT